MSTDLKISMLTAASAGCVADIATFPLDTAKVRLQVQGAKSTLVALASRADVNMRVPQLQYQGLFGTISTIARQEGPRALYNGLVSGLQRQMCFASIRLGFYEPTKQFYQDLFSSGFHPYRFWDKHQHADLQPAHGLHIGTRMLAGFTTGALAVLLAHPTDMVTVRYQASAKGSGHQYSSIFNAYRSIAKNEGFTALWRGMLPNITKNGLITVAEIVCYDVVKDALLVSQLLDDGVPLHLSAAVSAGVCATVVASPVDVIKTRYINAKPGEYKSALDTAIRLVKQEGVSAFYKGFIPSVSRFVSWNIVMWMTYEHIKSIIVNYGNDNDD